MCQYQRSRIHESRDESSGEHVWTTQERDTTKSNGRGPKDWVTIERHLPDEGLGLLSVTCTNCEVTVQRRSTELTCVYWDGYKLIQN